MDVKSNLFRMLLVIPFALSLGIAGCGNKEDAGTDQTQDEQASAVTPADATPDKMLVGTWYGKARLDQDRLQKKLQSIQDPVQRELLQSLSRTFETTEIGAQYGDDGSMMLDIQLTTGGQILRDSTRGTWRTVKTEDNAIFIETVETLPTGGTETNQVRYQFERDGQFAVMVAPTSEQLADCNPVFVFERVAETPSRVADGANDGVFK